MLYRMLSAGYSQKQYTFLSQEMGLMNSHRTFLLLDTVELHISDDSLIK